MVNLWLKTGVVFYTFIPVNVITLLCNHIIKYKICHVITTIATIYSVNYTSLETNSIFSISYFLVSMETETSTNIVIDEDLH